MSSFIALRKTIDLSADNNRHLLVGRLTRDLPQSAENGAVVTALKKHYDYKTNVHFDLNYSGAQEYLTSSYTLGKTYGSLPTPTRTQHIFNGWYTLPELQDDLPYDAEVEYLESTGMQWIDTGVTPDENTGIEVFTYKPINTTDCYIVGLRNNSGNSRWCIGWSSNSKWYIGYGTYHAYGEDGEPKKIGLNFYNSKTFTVEKEYSFYLPNLNFVPEYNIRLFGSAGVKADYTTASVKIMSVQITQNTTLIQDLIPVRVGNVGYMYDKVSGLLFENKGSGSFVIGNDVRVIAGNKITTDSVVELSTTTLYAEWEHVDIGSDCTEYIVSCNSNYKNTGIYSANRYSTTSAVYVDWGDGNVDKVNGNISLLSHSYTNTGIYTVKVSNNLTSFAPSYNNSTWYNTTSQNRYTFKSMVKTGSRLSSTAAMPSYAFYYCSSLSSIDWLSSCYTGLTALPSYAFYYCQGITSLSSLPSRIKSLGSYVFYYCTGLTGIQDLRSTGLTSLYNSNIFLYCTNVKEWKLPSTLTGTYFGSNVFRNNSTLSAIQLPASLTAIASYCFYSDTLLKNISIPAKVAVVNSYAFYNCLTLSSIDWLTTALTSVLSYAFLNCYALRDLNLPDTTRLIGNYAFLNCKATQASVLTLPSSLTSVGSYAYQGCYSLKNLDIPSSLTVLNDYAFAGCYNLSSIVDLRLTAQTTYANTFGNTASNTASNGYTGYATHGSNILCTYAAATGYDDGYWNDPLQDQTKCGFNRQYIDPENLRYCTIYFDAGEGSVSETSRLIVYGRKIKELPKPICPDDKPYFGGWYTEVDGAGTKYSANSTAPSQDSLTLYAFYSAVLLKSYTVDLNGQWRLSTTLTNPDSTLYDGVYESNSNYNVNSGFAKMYVRISGYDDFTIYIRSYGESSYDYTLAFNNDVDITSNPSTGTSGVKAHTSGNLLSGQAIGNYTKVTYTGLAGEDHFICIVYRKDGSVNSGNDRGYVLIPKEQ